MRFLGVPVSTFVLAGILTFFSGVMALLYTPAIPYVDSDGLALLRTAKGLAMWGDPAQRTSDPFEFVGEQMVEAREGVFYSKYPIGYPLLCAIAYLLGGPAAPFVVSPLLGTLSLLGIYLLASTLSGNRAAGVWAAALLAANPLHLMYALGAHTHTAALCVATWGMFFLWRWARPGGGGLANAASAGFLIAFGATIRYPDALLLLPLAALTAWRWRSSADFKRAALETVAMGVTALIAVAPQLGYHWVAFGSPWTTGYALSQESTAFSWSWFVQHGPWIVQHLLVTGHLPLFVLGTGGILYLAVVDARRAVLLGLWGLPLSLLYCSYYCITSDVPFGNLRYYLTMLPAFIVSALLLASAVRRRRWLPPLLVAPCFLPTILAGAAGIGAAQDDDSFDPASASIELSTQLRARVPEGAVILSADAVLYSLDYEGRYTLYYLGVLTEGYREWARAVLARDHPSPYQRPRLARLVDRLEGKSAADLTSMQVAIAERHLAAGNTVILLAVSPGSMESCRLRRPAYGSEDGGPSLHDAACDPAHPFREALHITRVHEFALGKRRKQGDLLAPGGPRQVVTLYELKAPQG